jgi:hypothetical protein
MTTPWQMQHDLIHTRDAELARAAALAAATRLPDADAGPVSHRLRRARRRLVPWLRRQPARPHRPPDDAGPGRRRGRTTPRTTLAPDEAGAG